MEKVIHVKEGWFNDGLELKHVSEFIKIGGKMGSKMKFRKKSVEIEAMQYTGNNGNELYQWSGGTVYESPVLMPTIYNPTGAYVQVKTPEGVMTGVVGVWIIRGVKGEFYPVKNDIFRETYEGVEDIK